ncbi:MAG: type II toxin-antitoxin system VapC family toxin [Chloroflexi bacterium]|nr:type II toxin-antitoxin system VapC family toxin [Chloroflexota bacterium]
MKPIFADTNLFLRYLTNDVPEQAEAVERLLRRAGRGEVSLVTNIMVMAELVWVMESFYKLSPQIILDYILAIVNTPGLRIVDDDLVVQAVVWYAEKGVDFIDALNAAWMIENDIEKVYTFDRKHFRRFEELTVISPTNE